MASKKILLLLDSDRASFPLLHFLTGEAKKFGWKIKVGTLAGASVFERIRTEAFAVSVEFADFKKNQECDQAIRKSDLVIGIVQDKLLLEIADSCITHRKSLISPSRLNRQMALKKSLAKDSGVFILMDCGFAPGLDHIIAKKAIDNIHSKGGKISSFKTYSGNHVAQSDGKTSDLKLTEAAADVISWGKHNNRQIVNGRMQHIPHHRLFERSEAINIGDLEDLRVIPEGDSLYYKKIYDLVDAKTVIKGKLVQKGFDRLWSLFVKLGLTDSTSKMDFGGEGSLHDLLDSLLPPSPESMEERLQQYTGAAAEEIDILKWLGLFDTAQWPDLNREITPAHVLQQLLEKRFSAQPGDQDRVVMEHQLGYEFRDDHFEMKATLILQGEDEKNTALAKVIGFTCGAAAKSVLLGSINVKGLHIPILREIYDPILNELEDLGIAFRVTERKFQITTA